MRRRVVVTGVGAVSPVGLDALSTWDGVLAGRSGIGPMTTLDAYDYPCRLAGDERGFDPAPHIDPNQLKKMDMFTVYAIVATTEALRDAGLVIDASNAERVGVYIGSGIGGFPILQKTHQELLERGPRRISPF